MRKLAIALVLVALAAGVAGAHSSSITYGELVIDGDRVSYVLKLESRDLYEALGLEADRPATRAEALAGQKAIAAYVLRRIAVTRRGEVCMPTVRPMSVEDSADGYYAVVGFDYACPQPIDQIGLRYDLFFDLDKLHEGRARVTWRAPGDRAARTQAAWFRTGERSFAWDRPAGLAGHRTTGSAARGPLAALRLDHLALLLALAAACAGRQRRRALAPLGAAAVGLSLGLAVAATGWHLASAAGGRLGLILCAASAALLAIENLVLALPDARQASALAFALVHGAALGHASHDAGAAALAGVTTLALGAALALTLTLAGSRASLDPARTRITRLTSLLALALAAVPLLLQLL